MGCAGGPPFTSATVFWMARHLSRSVWSAIVTSLTTCTGCVSHGSTGVQSPSALMSLTDWTKAQEVGERTGWPLRSNCGTKNLNTMMASAPATPVIEGHFRIRSFSNGVGGITVKQAGAEALT